MNAQRAQPPEQSSAGAAGKAADSGLLMDRFLPRYDFAVVHADVLRAPPAQCYGAARTPSPKRLPGEQCGRDGADVHSRVCERPGGIVVSGYRDHRRWPTMRSVVGPQGYLPHLQVVANWLVVHPDPASLRKLWQARWNVHSMSALTWPRSLS